MNSIVRRVQQWSAAFAAAALLGGLTAACASNSGGSDTSAGSATDASGSGSGSVFPDSSGPFGGADGGAGGGTPGPATQGDAGTTPEPSCNVDSDCPAPQDPCKTAVCNPTLGTCLVVDVPGCTAGGCGDGSCGQGETCETCPQDCGTCTPPNPCGDGTCAANESCETCPQDCGECPPPSQCGDGTCSSDESCETCPQDCGECPPPSQCGDGTCSSDESCETCPQDCGECPPPQTGACCLADGTCQELDSAACASAGGTSHDGMDCSDADGDGKADVCAGGTQPTDDCPTFMGCADPCIDATTGNVDQACFDQCSSTYPKGAADFDALIACLQGAGCNPQSADFDQCAATNCPNEAAACSGGGGTSSQCGDGTCSSDESCETCPQDCGDCPPPQPAACCLADGTCQELDANACASAGGTSHDGMDCSDANGDGKADACAGGAQPTDDCPTFLACADVCVDATTGNVDQGCYDQCTASYPQGAADFDALVACAQGAGCDPQSASFDQCLATNCPNEASACSGSGGGGGNGDCCSPDVNTGGTCTDTACANCVCALDDFCCTQGWDVFCADCASGGAGYQGACTASNNCAAACGCTDNAACCTQEPSEPCLLTSQANCQALGGSFVAGSTCVDANGDGTPDACAAGGGGTGGGTTGTGDCCTPQSTPSCGDSACASCVCAMDDYCCSTAWDEFCVDCASGGPGSGGACASGNNCAATCGCSSGGTGGGGSGGGGSGGGGSGGGGGTGPTVTWSDVKPILKSYCTPCHDAASSGGACSAGLCFVDDYAAASQYASYLLQVMQAGSMPPSCYGNPSSCVPQQDIATISAWISAGTPQ